MDPREFSHLGKLDGDIVMPPEYLAEMLERFRADPRLGMASGGIFELGDDGWRLLPTPLDFVSGACRLYSRACFEAIGGMPERLGADAITITYAKLRGFRTASLVDLEVHHLRPHGTAQGALRGHARHGAYQYIVHYTAAWILLRSAMVAARQRPRGLSGLWLLGGYVAAALRGVPQVEDPKFRAFMRAEQRVRMGGCLGVGRGLGSERAVGRGVGCPSSLA